MVLPGGSPEPSSPYHVLMLALGGHEYRSGARWRKRCGPPWPSRRVGRVLLSLDSAVRLSGASGGKRPESVGLGGLLKG